MSHFIWFSDLTQTCDDHRRWWWWLKQIQQQKSALTVADEKRLKHAAAPYTEKKSIMKVLKTAKLRHKTE